MPVDKQVHLRYQVLNRCLRNRYREYTLDDLVDECNKTLRRYDKSHVSKRTIQKDLNAIEADYHILLDETLRQGRKRIFRYADTNQSIPLYNINDEERNKIDDAIRVMEQFEGEPVDKQGERCEEEDLYHNVFLENLLIIHKWLIHSCIEKSETAKETNWEQKFQKPQNENICLTNLNAENNGNFHFLSFEEVLIFGILGPKIGSYNQHNKPIFIKNVNYW